MDYSEQQNQFKALINTPTRTRCAIMELHPNDETFSINNAAFARKFAFGARFESLGANYEFDFDLSGQPNSETSMALPYFNRALQEYRKKPENYVGGMARELIRVAHDVVMEVDHKSLPSVDDFAIIARLAFINAKANLQNPNTAIKENAELVFKRLKDKQSPEQGVFEFAKLQIEDLRILIRDQTITKPMSKAFQNELTNWLHISDRAISQFNENENVHLSENLDENVSSKKALTSAEIALQIISKVKQRNSSIDTSDNFTNIASYLNRLRLYEAVKAGTQNIPRDNSSEIIIDGVKVSPYVADLSLLKGEGKHNLSTIHAHEFVRSINAEAGLSGIAAARAIYDGLTDTDRSHYLDALNGTFEHVSLMKKGGELSEADVFIGQLVALYQAEEDLSKVGVIEVKNSFSSGQYCAAILVNGVAGAELNQNTLMKAYSESMRMKVNLLQKSMGEEAQTSNNPLAKALAASKLMWQKEASMAEEKVLKGTSTSIQA